MRLILFTGNLEGFTDYDSRSPFVHLTFRISNFPSSVTIGYQSLRPKLFNTYSFLDKIANPKEVLSVSNIKPLRGVMSSIRRSVEA